MFGGLSAVLLAGWGWLVLPVWVEGRLQSLAANKMPGLELTCKVRRIGLTGVDLASVSLASAQGVPLRIDSVRIDYSLSGLLAGHLRQVSLGGLSLHGAWRDNRLVVPGLTDSLQSSARPKPEAAGPVSFALPFTFGAVVVENGILAADWSGRKLLLPFFLRVARENPVGLGDITAPLQGVFRCYPAGKEMVVAGRVQWRENTLQLALTAADLDLNRLAVFCGLDRAAAVGGRMSVQVDARLGLHPLRLDVADLELGLAQFQAGVGGIVVAGQGETPVKLSLVGGEGGWRFQLNHLALRGPVDLALHDLAGSFSGEMAALQGAGKFLCRIEAAADTRVEGQGKILESEVDFTAKAEQGQWRLDLQAKPIAGSARPEGFFNYEKLAATLRAWPAGTADFEVELSGGRYKGNDGLLELPRLEISGRADAGAKDEFRGQTQISVRQGRFSSAASGLALAGLNGRLAVAWPPQLSGAPPGELAIERLSFQGNDLGAVKIKTRQQGTHLLFDGVHASRVLTGITVNFHADLGYDHEDGPTAAVELRSPRQAFTAFDIGRLARMKEEVTLAGELELMADFKKSAKGSSGELSMAVHGGRLEMPGRQVNVDGIELSLQVPELLTGRSASGQRLTFAKARVGGLEFNDGRLVYQLEPPASLYLESGGFAWCGGHVYSQALRFSPNRKDYDLVLFCDRLNLAQILEQFGVDQASGEGSVSGRIPVAVNNGVLRFDDGFLFSSPGEEGIIKVGGMQTLAAGLPKNSAQYAQLDFAGAALKNFHYKWAKLLLLTEGEDLVLQMKLDGQPAEPIPFRYDRQLGSFSRLGVDGGAGIKQPIRLDMNLRLPLEKILGYGGNFQQLYKMTQ